MILLYIFLVVDSGAPRITNDNCQVTIKYDCNENDLDPVFCQVELCFPCRTS